MGRHPTVCQKLREKKDVNGILKETHISINLRRDTKKQSSKCKSRPPKDIILYVFDKQKLKRLIPLSPSKDVNLR